jgi:hypothetical protein
MMGRGRIDIDTGVILNYDVFGGMTCLEILEI